MRMCHFWAQNGPFVLNKFFWYKSLLVLSSTYWPCTLYKILKILTADPELWACTFFGPKMVHLPQNVFGKILILFSSTYKPLSLCKILKKFFQSYEDEHFLGPKWLISPNENFFRKPVNEPCFFHSCLSTC